MKGSASVKVPEGKLVSVSVTYGETIESVTITGDFFLEPPAARDALEGAIEGHPVEVEATELRTAIEQVEADLIGFGPEDLVTATLEAIR